MLTYAILEYNSLVVGLVDLSLRLESAAWAAFYDGGDVISPLEEMSEVDSKIVHLGHVWGRN